MFAIKEIQDMQTGAMTIQLPADFPSNRAEIIILPLDDVPHNRQRLQDVLLHAPTMTDAELQPFAEAREWMSQWTIKTF
jgi:hypothetical protein